MHINWRRGFVRLWIVATAGWLAFVTIGVAPDAVSGIKLPDARFFERAFELQLQQKAGVLPKRKRELLSEAISRNLVPKVSFGGRDLFDPKLASLPREDQFRKTQFSVEFFGVTKEFSAGSGPKEIRVFYEPILVEKRNKEILSVLALAILPPVLSLVVGWALFWAGRGFVGKRSGA